jgi:hypothetical protein
MKNKLRGLLMQLPTLILLVIIVIGGFYLKLSNFPVNGKTLSWATPITILIIIGLYFWGRSIENKASKDIF